MTTRILALLAAMVCLSALAASEVAPRVEHVSFKNGADSIRISDSIKGRLTAEYRLRAKAGQMLTVDLKPSTASAYFNITAKGEEYALFNGSIMGNHFLGPLPADGDYIVQVYLMRNAARRSRWRTTVSRGTSALQRPIADHSTRRSNCKASLFM